MQRKKKRSAKTNTLLNSGYHLAKWGTPTYSIFQNLWKTVPLENITLWISSMYKKILQTLKSITGTTCVGQMQQNQQYFVLHAFKSDD